MSFTVLSPGLLTTVQDLGRTGYQKFGVPVSGVMDPRSAALANLLAGNPEGEAVLECTLMGPRVRFDRDTAIAVTGGDLGAALDGSPLPLYRAVSVRAGQILSFTAPRSGCRCWIAFAGGLDVPSVMGSRSTYLKAKMGGWQGRKLEKGDVIPFRSPRAVLPRMEARVLSPEYRPREVTALRVVLGPQDDAFTEEGLQTFLSAVYTVTPESDRMGCRLSGPSIAHRGSADIISDGIAFGAIQVPSSGTPILMLADRQTTGGYAKIANVITVDFRLLAQLKAGDRVRFAEVSVQEAQSALLAQRRAQRVLEAINR